MEDENSYSSTPEEIKAFRDGVRYALDRLEEVFGTEVTETDVWKEYNPGTEGEDN
jgi:hypothetical protein